MGHQASRRADAPEHKAIKARIPVLQDIAEKARVQTEQLLEESAKSRTGKAADLAKDLVSDYRGIAKTIKGYIATAKKLAPTRTCSATNSRRLAKSVPYDKLLPVAQKMHDKIIAFQRHRSRKLPEVESPAEMSRRSESRFATV